MASRITNTKMGIRGFGRNDAGFKVENIDATNSSFSEASPVPGIPSSTSRLRTVAAGGQSLDIDTRVQVSGSPGRGEGAETAWRPSSSSDADDWTGFNPPNVVTGWGSATFGATPSTEKRSIATLPVSQRPVMLWLDKTNNLWKCATWDWSTMDYGSAVSISGAAADDTLTGLYGAITAVSETSLLAVVVEGDTASELIARVYESADLGATWSLAAEGGTPTVNDYDNKARLFWIPEEGSLSLWLEYNVAGRQQVEQYASSDFGATWSSISELTDDTNSGWCVLVFPGPNIVTWFFDGTDLVRVQMASAYDKVADQVKSAAVSSRTTTDIDGSVDADGVGWVQLRVAEQLWTLGSRDLGDTWTECDVGMFDSSDSATYVHDLACVHAGGRQFIACRSTSDTATQGPSAFCILAGGWTNVTTGYQAPTKRDRLFDAVGSGGATTNQDSITILPIESPGNLTLITETLVGAPTITQVDGGTQVATLALESQNWNWQPASMGNLLEWHGYVKPDAGNSGSAWGEIVLRSGSRELGILIYTNKIEVYDNTTLDATDSVVTPSDGVELLCVKAGTTAGTSYVFWRTPGAAQWTKVFGEALGQVTAATPSPVIRWGNNDAATACTFIWGWTWLRDGINLAANFGDPKVGAACRGKTLTSTPYPVEGVGSATQFGFLSAFGGPGRIGDTSSIPAGHDYDVSHLFPLTHPSPSVTWRSTDETEQTIIINPRSSAQTGLGSDSVVVLFSNVNFKTAHIEGANGGAYTTLGTWDASTGFSGLTAVLTGDTLTPNTSTTAAAGRYLQDGEMVGGTAHDGGSVYREIEVCDGGVWSTATTKHPSIRLGSNGGASGASWELWAHTGIVVIHDVGTWQTYQIRIPAQTTKDGYFEAGAIWMTGLKAVGRPWEDRTTSDLQPQVSVTEGTTEPGRREQLRKPARTVTISQPNPVMLHHLRNAMTTAPDYIASAADHEPLAARDDLSFVLQGLIGSTKGGEEPVLWCAKLPDASIADATVITDPTMFLYCNIVSSVQTESARGEEGVGEQLRVQSVTLQEITGT